MGQLDSRLALSLLERKARAGAWRVDWPSRELHWTPGVFALHDLAVGPTPPIEVAVSYYVAEARDEIAAAVEACGAEGRPFDLELRFRVPGKPIGWVRAVGEPIRNDAGTIVGVQGAFQEVTAAREAREEITARHERFRELADAMPVMVWAADPSGRVNYVNGHLERYAGHDLVSGWRVASRPTGLVHADDQPMLADCWDRAVGAGESAGCEVRFLRQADRSHRWHSCAVVPVRDLNGRIVRWFGTGIDVHERVVSAEEALALSRRLQGTLEAITDGFMVLDRRWRFVMVNPKAEKLLQRSAEDLVGKVVWEEFPAAVGSEFERRYRWARSTGQTATLEAYYPAPLEAWFRARAYPSDEGLAVYFQDITADRAAEQLLRTSEARYRAVTQTVTDAVWDWDLATDTIVWNDGLRRHFGHEPAEVATGEAWVELIHPDDRRRVESGIRAAIARRDTTWEDTYRYVCADGSVVTVEDRGALVFDEHGEPVRFLGGMKDVTRELALEEQLRRSQRLEAVGHLVGGVAHDFNNLLTVIKGNSELLEEALSDDEDGRELARLSRQAADRGADLTGRLLAFARKQPLAPRAVDVPLLVESMGLLIRRTLREDITFETYFADDLPAVFVDPAQLEATLLNLVVNAQDAMEASGRLCIECTAASLDEDYVADHPDVEAGEYLKLVVSDTGSGISREDIDHVFEPFFTTKRPGKGTGLGLSTAYGFVRQSGGHIQVYSEPGHGTSVKLYLPPVGARDPIDRWSPTSQPESSRASHDPLERHILVVEDDSLVRQNVVRQLGRLGYRVTAVPDGPEALRAIGRPIAFDLLFTDVVLTGPLSGPELAREVQREAPALPVLFTSGYGEALIAQRGHLEQGVSLLAKPYTRAELARAIETALASAAG